MANYRLYLMDHRGHIQRAVEMDCDDDGGAVRLAEEASEIVGAELWQGARLVRRFEAPIAEPQADSQARDHPAERRQA